MAKLELTAAAKQYLQNYLLGESDAVGVRFSVKKSGCSGFKYVSEIINQVLSTDVLVNTDPKCYLARDSIKALDGMLIDHKVDAVSSELIYINPNAQDICGCGESFKVQDEE